MDFMALPDAGAGSGTAIRLENLHLPGCLVGAADEIVSRSLVIQDGEIAAEGAAATAIDMKGALAFPCFTDMHTHLDKAQMWARIPNPDGTFEGALNAVDADKPGRWDREDLTPRMSFALRSAYAHGTRAIRTHLDYFGDPADAERSWPVFADLREEWAGRIELQAAVLTGCDIAEDPAAVGQCADIVAKYGGILGTVTYPVPGVRGYIDTFFKAAIERDLPLDFHVDETLDPTTNTLRDIALSALDHDFSRKIVVGHLCSLSTMPEKEALETLDLVAKAGLHVVSLPLCNLYLQDRHAARTPRNRGITLVHEMKARGIPTSFASDNTRDPFYAFGDMDMLEVMREATRIGHLDHSDEDWFQSFTTTPSSSCDFSEATLSPGAPGDLVICKARTFNELFSRPQSDRIVLRGGRAIDRTLPDFAELDHLMEPL